MTSVAPSSPAPTLRHGRGADPRVSVGDARDPLTYPPAPFTVVTSPVYANKRLADYPNGPTPVTKTKGRRDYALDLGQPLHHDNLARLTRRPTKTKDYYRQHYQAVKHWGRARTAQRGRTHCRSLV